MTVIDWASLRHAYGPATDVPRLLSTARTAPASDDYRAEPWFSLWSALYHQDHVYPASYAAVPELLIIASFRKDAAAFEAALLAAAIELRRHAPDAPTIPEALLARYNEACAAASAWLPRLR